ncbi:hypothetical protein [Paenibacillus chitinolyticus]|uniref:hypothetical protein n=1 Tax=Paenibacillus chitinolyticus TaxID=79263 RepID=UPI001C48D637|nr:hypothetical protein [Paenibacillus chitinolyticus]MBV6717194.1 hypothetical protein [Paenibacillus chitinolyticus]
MEPKSIEIELICKKILRSTVLDVFYLLKMEKEMTKMEIMQAFAKYDPNPDVKITKFRGIVDISVAKLQGAMLIDYWQDGQADQYFINEYGDHAIDIMARLIEEEPSMLHGSRVVSKIQPEFDSEFETDSFQTTSEI